MKKVGARIFFIYCAPKKNRISAPKKCKKSTHFRKSKSKFRHYLTYLTVLSKNVLKLYCNWGLGSRSDSKWLLFLEKKTY